MLEVNKHHALLWVNKNDGLSDFFLALALILQLIALAQLTSKYFRLMISQKN
jgi:hypothetical protein